ncbi:hypothetical protein F965_00051 [Acinetobacter schindleri NIPH 900]|uniref:Uncharacterized protein n=1 Tax=Acinetobacter schindleri NIPH 900 TaxID=1217675 RepID=N8Y5V7_9GAMM|nr:hypothetical protein [Acinetobacter schindleri]ENV14705.1 hypothetical protein F965_00051 [Acinetobacter schindleri NIPH 900]
MLFEIINPSDECTMQGDNLEVLAVACCLIGSGRYALKGLDTEESVPMFIFGGHDEWFSEKFGRKFDESMDKVTKDHMLELVQSLDSVLLGNQKDRQDYEKTLQSIESEQAKLAFKQEFKEKNRSSINDICARSWQYADMFRNKIPQVAP